jgi:general secretion pathway protein K
MNCNRPPSDRGRERGAALITVVMMVAIMSTLAIGVMETARFGLQRTSNSEQMDAAHWYLLGAEAYAASLIDRIAGQGDMAAAAMAQSLDHPISLPVDGGMMQITVTDGANCFNLNSVVRQGDGGYLIANPDGVTRFALLLEISGVQNSQALAAALADWIDTDNMPLPGGAEANAYADDRPPPNRLISDRSELINVSGFDAEVLGWIAPFVCVRPTAAPNALNLETIRADQAKLLAAIMGRALTLADAEQLIAQRPAGGWGSMDAVMSDPRLMRLQMSEETRALLSRTSDWYVVATRVQVQDVAETGLTLVSTVGGHGRVVRRVLGAGSRERQL